MTSLRAASLTRNWCSPRSIGWQPGPPERIVPRPRPESPWRFILRQVPPLLAFHTVMVACCAVLVPAKSLSTSHQAWSYWLNSNPPRWATSAAPHVCTVLFGISGYVGIALHHTLTVFSIGIIVQLLHTLAPAWVSAFDNTQWPALFHRPFACTSLTQFWTFGWHSMLRRHLIFCGSQPMEKLFRPFGRTTSRLAGVLGAFALSGLLHEYSKSDSCSASP